MAKAKGVGSRFGSVNAPTMKSHSKTKAKAPAAKAPATKAKAAPKAAPKSASEKKKQNERSTVLRKRRQGAKGKSLKQRLASRVKTFNGRIAKMRDTHKKRITNLKKRQAIVKKNLTATQKTARVNLRGRFKVKLANRMKAKPVIKGNKIVKPKVGRAKFKPMKPKLARLPSARTGVVRKARKGTAAQRAGAKQGSRTRAKNAGKAQTV